MTRKEKIDYLIAEYEKGNYTTEIFCDQFVCILYYEEDESLNEQEYGVLDEYAHIFARFSPYEEDVKSGYLFGEYKIKNEFKKLLKIWNDKTRNNR